MMADVSGFTALSERYHNTGQGGAYRLTVTLNTYLGSLIELIYCNGGDIIKFAGDAFLALWKNDKRSYLCHTIHTVIACSLIIQQLYSSYETDVKINLKVKLAISAGNLTFAPIGTDTDKNFILTGLPVFEAKDAESVCSSGEVMLSPSAWGHCYSRNYDHILHDDGHVTIKSILYDPRESNVSKPFTGLGTIMRQIKKQYIAIENLPNEIWDEHITTDIIKTLKNNESLNVRETILESIEKNKGGNIRKFMIQPVVQQIDAHQPLEYLTEMRYVTIMFITLKARKLKLNSVTHLITVVNKAYEITCEIIYKCMGCVNKIILFDKDIMILVIFGLRGFKHESEAQAALKSAYNIKKYLSILDGVLEVSIGVTTGEVYCGVVGHPLRREFTVIGAIVNKAARLMCYFKNKITCDEATYIKSKLSANNFTLQPNIQLKGIQNTGKIYEYNEDIRLKEINNIPILAPLLNRSDEMECFTNMIGNLYKTSREYDAILIVGENRVGKSRLLEAMARQGRNLGINVCSITLTSIHSATPCLALRHIVNHLLQIVEPTADFKKEDRIVQLLKMYSDDLCYLNNILCTRFAYNENIYTQNENIRNEKSKDVFKRLITAIDDAFVLCIDDLHNLDNLSWEFISIILKEQKNILSVLTITKNKINTTRSWLYDVFVHNKIKKILIGPLKSKYIAPLACQILDVDAVPKDLCTVLETKYNCMPGLIETFIVHLFSSDAIDINRLSDDEMSTINTADFYFPATELLKPIALNEHDQDKIDELLQNEDSKITKICTIMNKDELTKNLNIQNMDALIIMQIDSLTPYQQLLLKIASVIGTVVSRNLLENIMYENNYLTTAKAIKRLFAMKLLICANNRVRWSRKTISAHSTSSLFLYNTCDCNFDYDENNSYNLPKQAFCNLMKFKNKRTRTTCYELLPLNQKKEFHTRIVNYLESNDSKCISCGGIPLIVQSLGNIRTHSFNNENFNFEVDLLQENENPSISENLNDTNYYFNSDEVIKNKSVSQDVSIYKAKSDIINQTKDYGSEFDSHISSMHSHSQNTISYIYRPSILKSSFQERRMTKRVTIPSMSLKEISCVNLEDKVLFPNIRTIIETGDTSYWKELGLSDSEDKLEKHFRKKQSYKLKLEKRVSQVNFKSCTCIQTKILKFDKLIHHAIQADLILKAIEFIIEYCSLNISENKISNVLEKLNDAENMCKNSIHHKGYLNKYDKKKFLGKIYTLFSAANIINGNYIMVKFYIEEGLRLYGINFNKFTNSFIFLSKISNKNHKRKNRGSQNIITKDCVSFLNVATLFYKNINEERIARISVYRAIQLLQKTDCSVTQICDTYCNALQIELDRGHPELTEVLEFAAQISLGNLSHIKAHELYDVGKLFLVSFHCRIARGLLVPAIRSGIRSFVISRFVYANNVSIEIIPDLFYMFLAHKRITEAVGILHEILQINYDSHRSENEIWYYALCMDMILDAGFQLEYPGNIIRYAEHINKNSLNCNGWRRLVLGIWTYCLRSGINRKTNRWETEAMKWVNANDTDITLTSLFNALRLSEGMLQSLSIKVDDLRKVSQKVYFKNIIITGINIRNKKKSNVI